MAASEVDALLERLVAQFESPYDFLRELVQNAMDAGSDRVEVSLETHPVAGEGDEVVFELTMVDTGAGMDEAIIDRELTRLFASGKTDDRTMAGGFGIGFVSVFAWEPEAVLVHTGRSGESWELLFHADRSFEKVALDDPVEGTTVVLFRRGKAREREAIAEAIRSSLWKWCRYCPLEIGFEDFDDDGPMELIQDAPEATGGPGGVVRSEVRGESTLRVSFGVPANAVFLRRGLVLAEGSPAKLLDPEIVSSLGRSTEHLKIWADSPQLRTTLARDKVVDDVGRAEVEARLSTLIGQLRTELLTRATLLAETSIHGEGDGGGEDDEAWIDEAWTPERHAIASSLHAHMQVEAEHIGARALRAANCLRDLAHGKGVSVDALAERMAGRPVLVAPPPSMATPGPLADARRELLSKLRPSKFPVVAALVQDDAPWLDALLGLAELERRAVERAISTVELRPGEAVGLCGVVQTLLEGLGCDGLRVEVASFVDLAARPERSPLFGPEVVGAAAPLAFHGGGVSVPRASLRRRRLWLNLNHALVEAAVRGFAERPLLSGACLTLAVCGQLDRPPEPGEVARLLDVLDASAPMPGGGGTPG